jgi:hypothetical protein
MQLFRIGRSENFEEPSWIDFLNVIEIRQVRWAWHIVFKSLNVTLKEKFGSFGKTMVDQVKIGRLTKYLHRDIVLLKIDVEGSEVEIIQELIPSGNIYNVKNIIVDMIASSCRTQSMISSA